MTTPVWSNNGTTTLAFPITSGALSLTLSDSANFASPTGDQVFSITLVAAANPLIMEIVYCTARSGDVCTIVRAREGTTALAWNAGDLASNFVTAGLLNLLNNNFSNFQVFTASGTFVVPGGITKVMATVSGGGGGGQSCQATSLAQNASGGGGGAGGTAVGIYAVTPGDSIAVTVGAGGSADTNGTASLFGVLSAANGGNKGQALTPAQCAGGTGGTAVNGNILNVEGGYGSDGQSGTFVFAGNGAPGFWGGAGRAGAHGGEDATFYGSGGGGAYDSGLGGIVYAGGAGGSGLVIVQW